MRILQVLRAPVGGLFRHVLDLTQGLAERGHEVAVVADSASGDAMTDAKLARLSAFATLGVSRMPMPRLLGIGDVTTPRRLGALARRLDIEIIHGHGAKGGLVGRMAPGTAKRFYTPHGGALHYNPKSPIGAVFMAIERGLLARTDTILFESAYAEATYRRQVAVPRCRSVVAFNGLAPAEFEPVLPAADAADFVFVGELRLLKGIDLLVQALATLARPDGRPATLVMAGDGPDRDALQAQIAVLGMTDRVTLAGVQPAREMFARGRVVVVPSRAESLPYIVLEAGAAGRPVIASRVGGIPEIFGDTAGALVTPNAVEPLQAAMAAALADPTQLLAETAKRSVHISEVFTLSRMVDTIEAEYRASLAQ